jgi:hypothetical protein
MIMERESMLIERAFSCQRDADKYLGFMVAGFFGAWPVFAWRQMDRDIPLKWPDDGREPPTFHVAVAVERNALTMRFLEARDREFEDKDLSWMVFEMAYDGWWPDNLKVCRQINKLVDEAERDTEDLRQDISEYREYERKWREELCLQP